MRTFDHFRFIPSAAPLLAFEKRGRRRRAGLWLAGLLMAGGLAPSFHAQAGSVAFGPVDVGRAAGAPVVRRWQFTIAPPTSGGFQLCVVNGGRNGQYLPDTSGNIVLNGKAIFGPADFKRAATTLTKSVTVASANVLTVSLAGAPGSGITLWIQRGASCGPNQAAHLIIKKVVVNDNGGTLTAAAFSGTVTGVTTTAGASWTGASTDLTLTSLGDYCVTENAHPGYDVSYSAECTATIAAGETKTCTITNNDKPARLVIQKVVVNDNGGTLTAAAFSGSFSGVTSASGATWAGASTSRVLTSVGAYSVTEAAQPGYDASFSASCTGTIALGETKTCTITNNDRPAHLIINKVVSGGTLTAAAFSGSFSGVTSAAGATWSGASTDRTLSSIGAYSVTEGAYDGYAPSYSADCTGTIGLGETKVCTVTNVAVNTNREPTITSIPITTATPLEPFVYGVTATDADSDPLTFSLTTAPQGMTIAPTTGLVSWTPLGVGEFDVTVRVQDGRGGAATQSFSVAVTRPANRPPELVPVTNRRVPAGAPFQLRVFADDPDIGDTLTFALIAGPAGASLGAGATLAWTPSAAQTGVHPFTVSVQDQAGLMDRGDFTIEVVATSGGPLLDPQPDATTPAGGLHERAITATDPDPGDAITYTVASGPAGLTLSAAGFLSWQPTAAQLGTHQVRVMATDSSGLSDAAAFTITVEVPGVSQPPIAVDDGYAVRRGTTLSVPAPGVLVNDSDPGGQPLTAQLVTPPTKGTLNLQPNGRFDYIPTPPAAGSTEPQLRFSIAGLAGLVVTIGQPLVIDLDRDGRPEIAFVSEGAFANRRLIAVNGEDGTVAFSVNAFQPSATPPIVIGDPYSELAAGDLDGDGFPEIIAVDAHDGTAPDTFRRTLLAFNGDGTHRWTSQDVVEDPLIDSTAGFTEPAIADLNGDGIPEIIVGYVGRGPLTPANVSSEDYVTVFNNLGRILWTARGGGTSQTSNPAIVADIDLDGRPEILFSDDVFTSGGVLVRSLANLNLRVADLAVANLDDDPFAETLYLDASGRLWVYEHTGVRKWGPITPPGTGSYGLGLPAIGDVDGDGQPEIVVARDQSIAVMGRDGSALREIPLPQIGYGGNVTIFDLNGDGRPELIYQSGLGPFDVGSVRGALYIINGQTGDILHALQASRNAADDQKGPIVADVNGDGSAEIVTGGWNESTLLRVFGARTGQWAQTRPVWNQYAYHVTNVNGDGTIPARAAINWLTPGMNNFRVNIPLPEERNGDSDQFTYDASNGALSSNVATVRLDILPPNTAPRILSRPPTAASPDLEYIYGVRAVDPDIGETLIYSLAQAPAGMTIDGTTGLVRWTPPSGQTGTAMVTVRVTDLEGQFDLQGFSIVVGPPTVVPDVVGGSVESARAAFAAVGLGMGSIATAPSVTAAGAIISQEPGAATTVAAGATVNVVVSSGPAAVTVPYLVGKTERAALTQLAALGFGNVVSRVFSNSVPDGHVVSQVPSAGAPLVPGAVTLSVSAGSGLSLRLLTDLTTADVSIPFTVGAYDLNYAPLPAPTMTYTVTPAISPSFGAMPMVVGSTVAPSIDTRGAFRLTATDPATGRAVSADFAVTFPHVAGERSMADAFTGMSRALADIDSLARQGRAALAVNDTAAIGSVLSQMVQRWRQVDSLELLIATPFGLPQGYFPAPSDLPSLGLSPTADDLLAQQVLKDIKSDLDAWIDGLREPATSMTALNALADQFNARAARLQTVSLGEWGVIKGAPLITAILSDRLPALYDALMDDLAQVVGAAVPGGGPRPSLLGEQIATIALNHVVEKIAEASSPLFKARSDMMKNAAWAAAAVMAANRFRTKVQGQELTAVVAGASLSFRVFRADYSFVEADLDTDVVENNVVIMIGPDQIEAREPDVEDKLVSEIYLKGLAPEPVLNAIDNGDRLYDALMKTYDWLKEGKAAGVADTVGGAFQGRGGGYKGCLFSSSPTCGQLVYLNGFKPVYTVDAGDAVGGFAGLPVPILVLVYNKTTGVLYLDTPVFLPWVP